MHFLKECVKIQADRETFQAYIEHHPYSEKVSEAWDYLTGYDYIGYLGSGETRAFSVKIPYFKKMQVNRFERKSLYN